MKFIVIGKQYAEEDLHTMFPKVDWDWWFGIDGELLINGRGHQFGFSIDRRRSKPFYLRGLSKGSFGDWTSVCYAFDKGEKRIDLRTLKPIQEGESQK